MNSVLLELPSFGYIVVTRAALALGVGLLLADRIPEDRRRAIGLTLVAVGAVTTIPALFAVARALRRSERSLPPAVSRDPALIGVTRLPRKGDDDVI